MRLFKTIRRLWNRWRFTGTFRKPRLLTLSELEQLAELLAKTKSK